MNVNNSSQQPLDIGKNITEKMLGLDKTKLPERQTNILTSGEKVGALLSDIGFVGADAAGEVGRTMGKKIDDFAKEIGLGGENGIHAKGILKQAGRLFGAALSFYMLPLGILGLGIAKLAQPSKPSGPTGEADTPLETLTQTKLEYGSLELSSTSAKAKDWYKPENIIVGDNDKRPAGGQKDIPESGKEAQGIQTKDGLFFPRAIFRTIFKENNKEIAKDIPPPITFKPPFMSTSLTKHLLTKKTDTTFMGQKWKPGSQITNMEAAFASFMAITTVAYTPTTTMWEGAAGTQIKHNEGNKLCPIIVSGTIQPDLEKGVTTKKNSNEVISDDRVILKMAEISTAEQKGKLHDLTKLDQAREKLDKNSAQGVEKYDNMLKEHMIYHLYDDHSIPTKVNDLKFNQLEEIAAKIEKGENPKDLLKGTAFTTIGGEKQLSLEFFFNFYREQLRNELNALDLQAPNGYVYTIDPPQIFLQGISGDNAMKMNDNIKGNQKFFNMVQAMALCDLKKEGYGQNIKAIGFNSYTEGANSPTLQFFTKNIGEGVIVKDKKELFEEGSYKGVSEDPNNAQFVLVEHNNSDGGNNYISNEGCSSADGYKGTQTTAAFSIGNNARGITDHIHTLNKPLSKLS